MQRTDRMRRAQRLLPCLAVAALATGCRTPRTAVVPLPQTVHDTVYVARENDVRALTVDSTSERIVVRGDTVVAYRYRERTKYRDRTVRDTLVRLRRDTVTLAVPAAPTAAAPERTARRALTVLVVAAVAAVAAYMAGRRR